MHAPACSDSPSPLAAGVDAVLPDAMGGKLTPSLSLPLSLPADFSFSDILSSRGIPSEGSVQPKENK